MSSVIPSFKGESPKNFEQKCLLVLALDVSGSMNGQPIDQLNKGLMLFQQEVMQDFVATQRLEIAVVTFGGSVDFIIPPSPIDTFAMPTLYASGSTPLVEAMYKSMDFIEKRKEFYKQTGQNYYRPMIILMTDGEPDEVNQIGKLGMDVKTAVDNGKFTLFGVGVDGYNHRVLSTICPPNYPPLPLNGLKFSEFFRWLSRSVQIVSNSNQIGSGNVNLPSVSGWASLSI